MTGAHVGVDTGGTFTDVVAADGRIAKVLSSRDHPASAVRAGVDVVGGCRSLAHGTTVATNAVLERRGGRVALVTTAGFADVLEIGRQHRPSLYDPFVDRPEPLVPRTLRFEVDERLAADGSVVVALDVAQVQSLPIPDDVEAVAVCFLHADLDPTHERAAADVLAPGAST